MLQAGGTSDVKKIAMWEKGAFGIRPQINILVGAFPISTLQFTAIITDHLRQVPEYS